MGIMYLDEDAANFKEWASGPFFVSVRGRMRQESRNLQKLLGPVITAMGYELVGIEYLPRPRNALLRIYIDKEGGVDLDDCQRVSYQVSGVLDVEDPIPGRYTLEISSPGLDRPLFTAEHFARFAGCRVKVRLNVPLEGRRNFTGVLQGVKAGNVVLDDDGREICLPLDRVEQARLVPDV